MDNVIDLVSSDDDEKEPRRPLIRTRCQFDNNGSSIIEILSDDEEENQINNNAVKKKKAKVMDNNDDIVETVAPPPTTMAVFKSTNDEVAIVAEKGANALSDFPHSRENCVNHSFVNGPRELHCLNCVSTVAY